MDSLLQKWMAMSVEQLDLCISEFERTNINILAQYKEYTREEARAILRNRIEENEWCISAIRNIIELKLSGS